MWKGLRVPLQSSVPSALIWLRPDWAGPEKDSGNPAPQGFAAGFSRSDGRPAYRTDTGGIRQTLFPERKLPAGAATKSVNRKYAKWTETSMCPQCSTGLFPGLGDRTGISYRTFMENFDYLRKQWCFGHLEMSPGREQYHQLKPAGFIADALPVGRIFQWETSMRFSPCR